MESCVMQVGLRVIWKFPQSMGRCPVTEQTVASVSLILHFFSCSCGVSDFSVDDRLWDVWLQNRSEIHVLRLSWRTLWNLDGKLCGSSFVPDFFIPATGALPPFHKCRRLRLVLKHTLRLSLSQQAQLCSLSSSSSTALASYKGYFWSRREESISFIFIKEQNIQVLPA